MSQNNTGTSWCTMTNSDGQPFSGHSTGHTATNNSGCGGCFGSGGGSKKKDTPYQKSDNSKSSDKSGKKDKNEH
jgi:hypothetical protein